MLEITQSELVRGLTAVKPAVPGKAVHPILASVRIQAAGASFATIESTDLEVFLTAFVQLAAEGEIRCVVPFRPLLAAAKTFGKADVLRLDVVAGDLAIECCGATLRVPLGVIEDFPSPNVKTEMAGRFEGSLFADALQRVALAASTDDVRPTLNGLLFEPGTDEISLTATDSYRLSHMTRPGEWWGDRTPVIVSRRACAAVAAAKPTGAVNIEIGAEYLTFRMAGLTVTTRIIQGDFPKYRQLMPAGYPNRVELDVVETAAAIARAKPVMNGYDGLQFRLNGGVELYAHADSGEFRAPLPRATGDYGPMTIRFNPRFFEDGLAFCATTVKRKATGTVRLELASPDKPGMMRPPGEAADVYILMPVASGR